MTLTIPPPTKPTSESIEAVALFSVLIHARDESDFERAAAARRELDDLGVAVKFKRTPRPVAAGVTA